MIDELVGTLIVNIIGEGIAEAFRSASVRRRQRRGRLKCGLRVEDGIQPGLTTAWRHGVVTLAPDRIRFDGADIPVLAVSLPPSDEGPRDRIERSADAPLFRVTTSTARLTWAIPVEQVDWALAQIGHLDDLEPDPATETV
ncbi:MAG TPA: hypothetical protein VJR25_10125 [Microbacterium sp.]|uniref:hypothetical protein n=1 Tax=Microbacterium sp. TaxID=51671 RepID=UPI002B482DF2|nr:hypothetical protein [Microbacterium sp.]HKT57116.1 hypothetical protein [Microbacterium sp.]